MDNPYKVIYKVKNFNKEYQYYLYIFVGFNIGNKIKGILNKIENLNLFSTLTTLDLNEYKYMEKIYGDKWYYKFFIKYHIKKYFINISKNKKKYNELVKKYGKIWIEKNIEKNYLTKSKIMYSYNDNFKLLYERKKKIKKIKEEDIEYNIKKTIGGGEDTDIPELEESIDTLELEESIDTLKQDKSIDNETLKQDESYEDNDEFDIDELDIMNKNIENIDTNLKENTKLINKLIEKNINKKTTLYDFDSSRDDNQYEDDITNNYKKYYIFNQYIYNDDTIDTIKKKITCSISLNSKFNNNNDLAILPSRIYLYSIYNYINPKTKKSYEDDIMIGQKWIKRNTILKISNIPNKNIRFYENLSGNLRLLKEDIKKYGNRIKREDDINNTINNNNDYINNNEIYMLDIYNEIGQNYNTTKENLENIYDVYIRIYYFNINKEELTNIINFLNKKESPEVNNINNIFLNYNNSLILDNEIMKKVEQLIIEKKYNDYSKINHITQTTIHLNIYDELNNNNNINIFRIFDNFIVSETYPFVIYQSFDGNLNYKFFSTINKDDKELIKKKWFDTAPYGISFKIKTLDLEDKYISINLNENGRIEYKNQFKEINRVELDHIKSTYIYVKKLIKKINSENISIKINIPNDNEYKFAFINSIQNFVLPKDKIINHNYLSELVRYFYPYFSLVIEPKKRLAKVIKEDVKSKYGTYLRYKRIDKFDNKLKIEYKIINFIRNYEHTDSSLAEVISKQFNITLNESLKKINEIKKKYPRLKKSRKILKSLDNIPKYKPPGIGVDIQGKDVHNYKIRISGARDKEQLMRINHIINIVIYIYIQIYIFKEEEYLHIRNKLNLFENIAKRLNKVEDIVYIESKILNVKNMIKMDKERIGFKPEKGQNQWTRSCQNSGTNKKRRPYQYNDKDLNKILKDGYKLNKKTKFYEKQIKIKNKIVTLRAVTLSNIDGKGSNIYYTCDPKINKEHMFIGFLSRSSNPYGHCMPCCFKKDQLLSNNKEKKNFFLECIGEKKKDSIVEKKVEKIDKLYILQDTNKIHEGRYGYLSKILDIFMNLMQNNIVNIKNHYLIKSETGYYFKYGSNQLNNNFLNAFAILVNYSLNDLINLLVNKIQNDNDMVIFTSLNNGEIRYLFKTRENYINYIKNNDNISYNLIIDLLSTKNIIYKEGLNILLFSKIEKQIIIDDKEKIITDYTIIYNNKENEDNLYNKDINTFLIIKDYKNYYPIRFVKLIDKNIEIINSFKYINNNNNIMYKIIKFYKLNNLSYNMIFKNTNNEYISRNIYNKLLNSNNISVKPKYQVIDTMYKCIYFILNNNSIILIEKPSGIIPSIPLIKNINKYISSLDNTIKNYLNLNKLLQFNFIPKYIYYNSYEKDKYNIIGFSIFEQISNIVPVKEEKISRIKLENIYKKYKISIQLKKLSTTKIIDDLILSEDKDIYIDERIKKSSLQNYYNESYNIFKLEISNFLNYNLSYKEKIEKIYNSNNDDKIIIIKKLLYDITINKLYNTKDRSSEIDIFKLNNYRYICSKIDNKDNCNSNIFCSYNNGRCMPTLKKSELYNHINRLSNEIIYNDLVFKEVLNIDEYYITDIINKNNFIQRDDQTILKSSNIINIDTILKKIFTKGDIPILGKKRRNIDIEEVIEEPLEKYNKYYIQYIVSNSNTIYRAFVNSFYWLKNELYEIEFRNLGYLNEIQTKLTNYFKGLLINWLIDIHNKNDIMTNLKEYFNIMNYEDIMNYVYNISNTERNISNNIPILYILNKIIKIPIIVYDNTFNIIYIYDNKMVDIKNNSKYKNNKEYINILYEYDNTRKYPSKIKSIYFI